MSGLSNFLMVSGLGLFCLGVAMIRKRLRFYRDSKITTGTIIDYERGETRRRVFAPIVEFELSKTKKIIFKSNLFSNKQRYEIGSRVPVRYKTFDPQEAEINKGWIIWFEVPICFIFSFVLLWLGTR